MSDFSKLEHALLSFSNRDTQCPQGKEFKSRSPICSGKHGKYPCIHCHADYIIKHWEKLK